MKSRACSPPPMSGMQRRARECRITGCKHFQAFCLQEDHWGKGAEGGGVTKGLPNGQGPPGWELNQSGSFIGRYEIRPETNFEGQQ